MQGLCLETRSGRQRAVEETSKRMLQSLKRLCQPTMRVTGDGDGEEKAKA